ncbi:hypothetical protein CCP3SC1AL1_1730004 [Gammaproteobacteria bacterium]
MDDGNIVGVELTARGKMARSYSLDLRERVKQAAQEGYPQNSVARIFKIGKATVGRYMARLRKTGNLTPDKMGGYKNRSYAVGFTSY